MGTLAMTLQEAVMVWLALCGAIYASLAFFGDETAFELSRDFRRSYLKWFDRCFGFSQSGNPYLPRFGRVARVSLISSFLMVIAFGFAPNNFAKFWAVVETISNQREGFWPIAHGVYAICAIFVIPILSNVPFDWLSITQSYAFGRKIGANSSLMSICILVLLDLIISVLLAVGAVFGALVVFGLVLVTTNTYSQETFENQAVLVIFSVPVFLTTVLTNIWLVLFGFSTFIFRLAGRAKQISFSSRYSFSGRSVFGAIMVCWFTVFFWGCYLTI